MIPFRTVRHFDIYRGSHRQRRSLGLGVFHFSFGQVSLIDTLSLTEDLYTVKVQNYVCFFFNYFYMESSLLCLNYPSYHHQLRSWIFKRCMTVRVEYMFVYVPYVHINDDCMVTMWDKLWSEVVADRLEKLQGKLTRKIDVTK